MVTVSLHTLLHPFASVTVTEYAPAVLTVIQFVVAPVLHKYEEAPAGTQSSVDCPSPQMKSLPLIVQSGSGLTTTVALHTLLHPSPSVTVTEYSPAVLTVMQFVVALVLHK